MKKILKLISLAMCGALVLTVLPISSMVTVSAAATSVGIDIDSWSQDYINELNTNGAAQNVVVSLTTDTDKTKGGQAVKIVYSNSGRIYFSNTTYWNYPVSVDGYLGVKYWVKNPDSSATRLVIRFDDNGKYSLKKNISYFLAETDGNTVKRKTTSDNTSTWSGESRYGEVRIPAGFEGYVYMPFSSFHTTPTELGMFRFDYFSENGEGGTVYFDELMLYDTEPTIDLIDDFENGYNVYYNSGASYAITNEAAFSGNALKITSTTESTTATVCANSSPSVNSADITNIRLYMINKGSDAYISFRFNEMSLKKGLTYYTVNKSDGVLKEATAGKNIFPSDWGNYLADIAIPANFEGWVYLPISSIAKQDGTLESTVCSNMRYDILFAEGTGSLYIDNITPGHESLINDVTLHSFDNWTDSGYLNDLNSNTSLCSSTLKLSANTEYSVSGQSIKMSIDGTSGTTSRVLFGNTSWISYYSRTENYDSIGIWFKNPSDYDVKMVYRSFIDPNGSLKNGAVYYLKHSDGTIDKKYATNTVFGENRLGEVIIPSGFEGYVIMPFTSWYTLYDKVGLFRLDMLVDGEAAVDIYMDDYTMYATEVASVPTLFSDGALFQQNKPINIWGEHLAGVRVTAELYCQDEFIESVCSDTDRSGKWSLSFTAREGSYDSYRILIKDSSNTFAQINDVLIGELWLSGGQSNMEFVVGATDSLAEIEEKVNSPYLRFFLEPTAPTASNGSTQPAEECDDIAGAYWEYGNTTGNAIRNKMSAVACVFAYNLMEELDVPVGVINTAVGGTKIDAWLGRDAVENNYDVYKSLKDYGKHFYADQAQTSFKWTTLYNQKIAPLAGLNIAGTIWYQGESDSNIYSIYAKQLDLLKSSWGEIFGFKNDSMPFIYTQVAPDCYDNGENNWFQLGYLAEAMNDAFLMNDSSTTAMLTLYDVSLAYGNEGTIHPNVKIPVGERFATAAMTLCYGATAEASAPVFDSIEIKGNTVYVHFTHTGTGLSCTGEDIHGFNIAGNDGVYVNAKAKIIDSDTVMVWNDYLKDPANVTYAFANMNQAANLVNSSGIPAAPFRSDRSSATYMTVEEWMNADADAWESIDGNLSDFKPSWTVSGKSATVSYSYSADVKTEGNASLAVAVSEPDTVTVSPVINAYDGKAFNAANYKSIKLDVKSNVSACVSLVVTDSSGNTYNAYVKGADNTAAVLGNSDFNTVTFSLEKLYDGESVITDVSAILTNANISFEVSGVTAETLYIDNISVGMTDEAAVFADVNDDGELNASDLSLIKKHLLGISCEINKVKCDANEDNDINIIDLIRAKKNIAKQS